MRRFKCLIYCLINFFSVINLYLISRNLDLLRYDLAQSKFVPMNGLIANLGTYQLNQLVELENKKQENNLT